MIELQVIATKDLINRAAIEFVQNLTLLKFPIYAKKDKRLINIKSILGVLSANIVKNDMLTIIVNNEEEAFETKRILKKFFEED